MDLHTFVTCLVAVTLLTLTPGLDTLLVIRNSVRGGWRDGIVSSFGICCGLIVHAVVSALGISFLLMQTAWAFGLLKTAGALYLLWLGLASWYRAVRRGGGLNFVSPSVGESAFMVSRSLREGFLSNVLNPKAVIFYMAFLPQFINPAKPALSQSLVVAGMHFLVAMVYLSLLSTMVDKAKIFLQQRRVSTIFDALTGSLMFYLGYRLIQER